MSPPTTAERHASSQGVGHRLLPAPQLTRSTYRIKTRTLCIMHAHQNVHAPLKVWRICILCVGDGLLDAGDSPSARATDYSAIATRERPPNHTAPHKRRPANRTAPWHASDVPTYRNVPWSGLLVSHLCRPLTHLPT